MCRQSIFLQSTLFSGLYKYACLENRLKVLLPFLLLLPLHGSMYDPVPYIRKVQNRWTNLIESFIYIHAYTCEVPACHI